MTGSLPVEQQKSLEVKLDIDSLDTTRSKESVVKVLNNGGTTNSAVRPVTVFSSTNFATSALATSNKDQQQHGPINLNDSLVN